MANCTLGDSSGSKNTHGQMSKFHPFGAVKNSAFRGILALDKGWQLY
jgi:hypothetical protein